MHIRHAKPVDLEPCLQLDGSFDTQQVWQLDLRQERDRVAAQLRIASLPRRLRVDYPGPADALLMHWQRGYCILVAEDLATGQILGYVDVGPEPDLQIGWIWHLVVGSAHRRQGIGSSLLSMAVQWSSNHHLQRLMVPLQMQNDPGIRFCQQHGFGFCGFNDQFFDSGGVALFFGRRLR